MKYLLAVLALIAATGCASSYQLTAVPNTDQSLEYYKGIPSLSSYAENSAVSISPGNKSFEKRAGFVVTVFNDSPESQVIDTTNIEVVSNDGSLKVFSAAELEKEARNAAAWQAVAVAMSSASNSYANSQAAYSSSYTTARTNSYGNVYTPSGTASYNSYGYGTATTSTYNPAVTQVLEAENRARTDSQMANIQSQLGQSLANVSNNILQATSVYPGQSFSSKFIVAPIKLIKGQSMVKVVVNFAGDVHTFQFDASPLK